MSKVMILRRVLGIGLAWAILWGVFWTTLFSIIGIVDPDSIDPGDEMAVIILGSMGLLTGVVFGILLSIGSRSRTNIDLSLTRVAVQGILATAVVQLGYLDHGDLGLAHNIRMALLFCAFGGVVTLVWLATARWWLRRHSPLPSSS